jgi:hypothetical protein
LNSHKIPAEIRGCPTRFKLYELRKGPLAVNLGAGVKLETLTLRFQLIKARTQIAAWLDEEFQGEGRLTHISGRTLKRACHRHNTGLASPDRFMILDVPQPSVASMILTRRTCVNGALDRAQSSQADGDRPG